ncbi:hypothetical protein ACU5AY_07235 [Rhizobium sp. PAMB 3174]
MLPESGDRRADGLPPKRKPRHRSSWVVRGFLIVITLVCIGLTGIFLALENGVLDKSLNDRVQKLLQQAVGTSDAVSIGSTALRFTSDGRLALEARDVTLAKGDGAASKISAVRLVLDPLRLARGQLSVSSIDASGIVVGNSIWQSDGKLDWAKIRVDGIPKLTEELFNKLDELLAIKRRGGLSVLRISDVTMMMKALGGRPQAVIMSELSLKEPEPGDVELNGTFDIGGYEASLSILADTTKGRAESLKASLEGAALGPLLTLLDAQGEIIKGATGKLSVELTAERGQSGGEATVNASAKVDDGRFYMRWTPVDVPELTINAAYDNEKHSLEVKSSKGVFGDTSLPFSGAVIDLDRLSDDGRSGFGFDFLFSGASADTETAGEAAVPFDAKFSGQFLTQTMELAADQIVISSARGAAAGSLRMVFGEGSPQVSFGMRAARLHSSVVKQLWPFWMASKAREWVHKNLFGGNVTNASLAVFIPAGRMSIYPEPLDLDENELRISFDVDNVRMNVAGNIPPIRDTAGHFSLNGPKLTVDIDHGTSYFPSGRSVSLDGGQFNIANTYEKPLMADMHINVSGAADGVAELATYKPIGALERTGFVPSDFSGKISAKVDATFGLIPEQDPPPPQWHTVMTLNGVDLEKEFSGHWLTNLDGTLDITPEVAKVDAKGNLDGAPMQLTAIEPVESTSKVQRSRKIELTLNNDDRNRILPGLGELIDGPLTIDVDQSTEGRQSVSVDITKAALILPWIDWIKGRGIKAIATFDLKQDGARSEIGDFDLNGDGFRITGDLTIGKSGLISADFDNVRLSQDDRYALKVKRVSGGYDVRVDGQSADMRSVLQKLKTGEETAAQGELGLSITANLSKLIGFNGEVLSAANFKYSAEGTTIKSVSASAVTDTGAAFVIQTASDASGPFVQITSGDAGAMARFADLYRQMQEGLLNIKIRGMRTDNWSGAVDIRKFRIVDEKRLQKLVSTPTGKDGQSLNSAVKRNIDVSSERFQRAFARINSNKGVLTIENGVVRGDQIGATFQGVLRDKKGQMSMTGTFMPAYGLNRLFTGLPIIGLILGNGNDQGVIGITFKLTGSFDHPDLLINPLSVIAPGIFRQIFEFQ